MSRHVFRALGVLPGQPFPLDAIAAAADESATQTATALRRLTAAHLIEPDDGDRFRLHDLLRRYAADRALPPPARHRVYHWYVAVARQAARLLRPQARRLDYDDADITTVLAGQEAAAEWFDQELPKLLAVIENATEHGPPQVAWLLAEALHTYFEMRLGHPDWVDITEAALRCATNAGELRAEIAMRRGLTSHARHTGDFTGAKRHSEQALLRARDIEAVDDEAVILAGLAACCYRLGELPEAARHCRESLRITGSDTPAATSALNILGIVDMDLGDLTEAADCLTQAVALVRQTGDVSIVSILGNLAQVHMELGALDDAYRYASEALRRSVAGGIRNDEISNHDNLSRIHTAMERYPQARHHGQQAVQLAAEAGLPMQHAYT
ncbi:MAG: tetratricopeptide repeat protein, partial [Stackebrandtia sp.]